jgi:hypothetical protein
MPARSHVAAKTATPIAPRPASPAASVDAVRELGVRFFSVLELARRWGVSPNTVRIIPRDELPFLELGGGQNLRRRRYHPADVIAFERVRTPRPRPRTPLDDAPRERDD